MSLKTRSLKTRASLCLWPAVLLLGLPAAAGAWQAQPTRPAAPRAVIVVQPPASSRFQQVVREHEVRDQLRKNQLKEQLRQNQLDMTRRPYATQPVQAARLDQADQAQRELYQARQQDLLDRYQSAVAPPLVHSGKAPASSRSSD
jgi:hypothetical protein